jgi:RimJ/RimL family protein N-acetyltransferase
VSGQRPDESLRTERLHLLPVTTDDADALSEVFLDERLYAFTGGGPGTVEALRSTFARLAADRSVSRSAQLNWVVRHQVDGKAIGMLQVIFTDGGDAAEIAWVVGVPWQGQGIATETATAVVAWLQSQGVRTVTAWIRPDHHASAAVARRAGLTATGEYRDTERHREQLWRLQVQTASSAGG